MQQDASVKRARRVLRRCKRELRALKRCEPKFPVDDYPRFLINHCKGEAIQKLEEATFILTTCQANVNHAFQKTRIEAKISAAKIRAELEQNLADNAQAKAVIAKDKVTGLEAQLIALTTHGPVQLSETLNELLGSPKVLHSET